MPGFARRRLSSIVNDPIAVGLLALGYTPGYVMQVLVQNDEISIQVDRHSGSRGQWRGAYRQW